MKIELSRLRGARNFDQVEAVISEYFREADAAGEPIYISDLIVDEDIASPLLSQLREDRTKKYHLRVIKDKWGANVLPGDIVKREFKKSLNRSPGSPRKSSELNSAMNRGAWEQEFIRYEKFVVDKKGCITCSADDMWYFLTHFGIHSYSRQRMSFHPHETSAGPKKLPAEPGMKHVHYWLYEEADEKQYEALPVIEVAKTEDELFDKTQKQNKGK